MQEIHAVVAGAGIWGCTLARRLAEKGMKVLVVESRPVVGGNVRCEIDPETGIEIHLYGSHIFHTHNDKVWSFVRRFVEFNGYQHKVMAHFKGKTYFLPLGLSLINKFFNTELKPCEIAAFMKDENTSKAIFDAFTRSGLIVDDNRFVIPKITLYAAYEKNNPHMVFELIEIEPY